VQHPRIDEEKPFSIKTTLAQEEVIVKKLEEKIVGNRAQAIDSTCTQSVCRNEIEKQANTAPNRLE
jgi:hypothetical protein